MVPEAGVVCAVATCEGPPFALWGRLAADGAVADVQYVVVQGGSGIGCARGDSRVLDKSWYGFGFRSALGA
eukprot:12852810-Alexandrium_andersonii.AAC.1